jgi:hypothetical protein
LTRSRAHLGKLKYYLFKIGYSVIRMNSTSRRYWYVSAGSGPRNFSEEFLRFGVMLIGSGDSGPFFENKEKYAENNIFKTFAEEVKPNDIIIMKHGVRNIVAAGIVDDQKYDYFEAFGDVDGFSLQHGRYVTWHKPAKNIVPPVQMPQGRLRGCNEQSIQQIAEQIIKENNPFGSKEKIPAAAAREIDDEVLIKHLIEHGLSSGQAEEVMNAFWRIRRLGRWYEDHWEEREDASEEISEYETRAFLIVPLLLALGWPEQRLKMEWKRVDIALFEKNYSPGNSPTMIIESKKLGNPLGEALVQAEGYADGFKHEELIVSNGIRYLLLVKVNGKWIKKAHLNMLKLLDTHPYDARIEGAPQLLTHLLP